jgi:Stage II sporulation protein E (SpoIIE)
MRLTFANREAGRLLGGDDQLLAALSARLQAGLLPTPVIGDPRLAIHTRCYRVGEDRLLPSGPPLGLGGARTGTTVSLPCAWTLFCYTDGLIEAHSGPGPTRTGSARTACSTTSPPTPAPPTSTAPASTLSLATSSSSAATASPTTSPSCWSATTPRPPGRDLAPPTPAVTRRSQAVPPTSGSPNAAANSSTVMPSRTSSW